MPCLRHCRDAGITVVAPHHYPGGQDPHEHLVGDHSTCSHVGIFVTEKNSWRKDAAGIASRMRTGICSASCSAGDWDLCHVRLPLPLSSTRSSDFGALRAGRRSFPRCTMHRAVAGGAWLGNSAAHPISLSRKKTRGAANGKSGSERPGVRAPLAGEPKLLRRIMCADPRPTSEGQRRAPQCRRKASRSPDIEHMVWSLSLT